MQHSADAAIRAEQSRRAIEHINSIAIILFNTDRKSVVLVNQIRDTIFGDTLEDGGIAAAIAGAIEPHETPQQAARRAAWEIAGYRVRHLTNITRYVCAPGGQHVHLYYAAVRNRDCQAKKDRTVAEAAVATYQADQVLQIPLGDLLEYVKLNRVDDPNLLIGAYWLAEELGRETRRILEYGSCRYALRENQHHFIGYKTGPITAVKGVGIWVNSENEDMIMDRFIGRSISANVRYLGAIKDSAGNVTEDAINDQLTAEIDPRSPVRIGTVVETGPGMLGSSHGVKAILHIATVRGGGPGLGVKADVDDLARCTRNALVKADELNRRHGWLKRFQWMGRLFGLQQCESILIPMIGGGDGGLEIEQIVPRLFGAAIKYYQDNPQTTIREIYFLAYTARQRDACERELARLRRDRIVKAPNRSPSAAVPSAAAGKAPAAKRRQPRRAKIRLINPKSA
jgi:8-oxo-dGTP pyrophosphatase MutT (NUDIX family)/O-acetyl-ADP-ribose deacetylase (regulator of RNase III)